MSKSALQSKTIVASMIGLMLTSLNIATEAEVETAATQMMELIFNVGTIISFIIAIYGD